MSEWIDIDERQPKCFQRVLWYCVGGNIRTGIYYGKLFCQELPESHPMKNRGRSSFGKFGRYAEPAELGYRATHWMPLPEPPK